MTENTEQPGQDSSGENEELIRILEQLLEADEDITARAVARLHSTIKHASSFTRSTSRSALLSTYQAKQQDIRKYIVRNRKRSREKVASAFADKDMRIAELEKQVEILTASHVAMIRAVGELGGYSKWLRFFQDYQEIVVKLREIGALPQNIA